MPGSGAWGRALGTGNQVQASSSYSVVDPWNLHSMYGPQFYDYKFIYSLTMIYQPPFYRTQRGIVGRLLGGWTVAPIFTAHSGAPLQVNNLNGNRQRGQTGSRRLPWPFSCFVPIRP